MDLLMIDDNPAMLSAAETALHTICNPVLADTGRSGIAAFVRRRPNVVVLDIRLPDLNGLEVLYTLKSIDPSVPVVILSAIDDTTTASRALKAGAFTYLTKPLELQSLLTAIQEATSGESAANGIILPSVVTKHLFQELACEYAKHDTIVLIGERGVGKRAFARAVHVRFHGSDQSFRQLNSNCLTRKHSVKYKVEGSLTACIFHPYGTSLELELDPRLMSLFRKIIIAVEVPYFDRNTELEVESSITRKWKALSVPPLRLRKSEAFQLLCYWCQKLAPDKNLDRNKAQERINQLEENGFLGNVGAVVELARELAEL
jgi:DNA-binding NtrC family response regulator